jgi:ABC-type glycerol-3-phosphate transport system substrate-binding protein
LYGYGLYVPATSDVQAEAWKFAAFLADNSEAYFTEAGVWLGDEAVLESEVTSSVPDWEVFAEGFRRGNFLPPLKNYNEISQALEDAIQRVVVNGVSAQQSLDTAHAEIEPLLQ